MLAEQIVLIGVNHKTAPVEVREKLATAADQDKPALTIRELPGCNECCFLSTCNRVEVLFVSENPAGTSEAVRDFLFAGSALSPEQSSRYSYFYQGGEAISHLFRVAASLDSMVVGEPQILGQLKEAYRAAAEDKATGVLLNRLLHKAFSVAKRVRTETNIGSSAVSISYAAVQLARKIFGDLAGKTVLLAGAGEMAELAAEHLVAQGIGTVVVANRTLERAASLARTFHGRAVGLAELVSQLVEADILISSTGAPDLILRKEEVKPIMRQRRNRPLFLIDIAVPRDLDPGLNDLDNVYLYDIDDLKQVVEVNKEARQKEADRAEGIVAEETLKFLHWLDNMGVAPTITALRKQADAIRQEELARTLGQFPDLPPKARQSIEKMSNAIINKLLHQPTLFLKQEGCPEHRQQRLALFRQVFGLDNGQENNSPSRSGKTSGT